MNDRWPLFWMGWFFGLMLLAGVGRAADLPPVPEADSLVVDQVGLLSEDERTEIEGRLKTIQDSERAQVALLISPGSEGEALEAYSLRVAESWQLGHAGKDDGLLILLVPSRHSGRIEVGYGLEGAIPDVLASRWLRELLPGLDGPDKAAALDHLFDQIASVLPAEPAKPDENYLFPDHPEWRLPFVLVVFSPMAIFPMFAGRWGGIASAPLLAAMLGGAAWSLWGWTPLAMAVCGIAFLLPLSWNLNQFDDAELNIWLIRARVVGNLAAVILFFAVITLFVGAGLKSVEPELFWSAPFFAGALALGLAAFLFPTRTKLVMVVLRSYMHFIFIVTIVYLALAGLVPEPSRIAVPTAAVFTALIAAALYAESRGLQSAVRLSHWLTGIALVLVVPFGLFLLFRSATGAATLADLKQAVAGGGSIAGVIAWAIRSSFFAALKIGLGGRFGGGGASED